MIYGNSYFFKLDNDFTLCCYIGIFYNKKKVYIYYYVMFINIPILNPLSNHLRIASIESDFTWTAVYNITLESINNLSLERWCIWGILWEDNSSLD